MGMLDGKVVIVSGVGPGLGRSIAVQLAGQGADVVLAARREHRLRKVADEIEGMGRTALCVPTDITDPASCDGLAAAAMEAFGRVDVLVNNAFVDGTFARFDEADPASWRATFDVNLFGTLGLTYAVLPHLKANPDGDARIVMVNTMSIVKIEERFGAYAASKGALATAAKTLAVELGGFGIRVNTVHPGYIYSPKVEWYLNHLAEEQGRTFDEVYAERADETCLKYLPDADEIAGAVVFLASPLARPITGQSIHVNAGHWIG